MQMRLISLLIASAAVPLGIVAGVQGTVAQGAAPKQAAPKETAQKRAAVLVEPQAVAALRRMSAYVATLNSAAVTSNGTFDVVAVNGQRLQLDGVATYKLRKPNGFSLDYDSDIKKRRFLYDGKTFTIYSPATGFYAGAPAPATVRET